ncbi:BolA family transcriptional regulator [Candidatus Woesearchaeota archaeon]|nr:BolA family transcriptional regulator [Candidatus Woesearchaeota archaeon]
MKFTDQIKQKIELALPGAEVNVLDQSSEHQEHNPVGAHIEVQITYSGFAKKSLLEQHQMIYKILQEEMKEQIHALKIKSKIE